MSDEITARFGFKNDPVGVVQTINSDLDFDNIDNLEGEHLVHKLNMRMDP